jgi:hypothetical protein
MGLLPGIQKRAEFLVYDENDIFVWRKEIDATISEAHSKELDVTEHPVSRGIPVTDNIRPRARKLSCVCFFTDRPGRIDEAVKKLITGETAVEVFEQLEEIADKGWRFTIKTSLRTYENMVIQSMTAPRTNDSANHVELTLTFKEIRKAKSLKVALPKRKPKEAQPKKAKGTQPKAKPPVERAKGMTKQLVDFGIKGIKKLAGG